MRNRIKRKRQKIKKNKNAADSAFVAFYFSIPKRNAVMSDRI